MKTITLFCFLTIFSMAVFAQSDSSNKTIFPPDFNNNSNSKLNNMYNQDGQKTAQDTAGEKENNLINKSTPELQNPNDNIRKKEVTGHPYPDGILMTNGMVSLTKGGKISIIEKEITMSNGTRVLSNGTIINKNGSITLMKEGEHMDLTGKLTPVKGTKIPKQEPQKK